MATAARGAFGTKLWIDDGTGTFVQIAECKDFSGPGSQIVLEDTTNMDSPSGYVERTAVGVTDVQDVTFQCNLLQDDGSQNTLRAAHTNRAKRAFRLIYPSATKRVAFTGYVAEINESAPVKGIQMHDVKITITGPRTIEANP